MKESLYPKEIANGVFMVWKESGETPLQALTKLRKDKIKEDCCDISQQTPMTYAGRLDPLANGELLILVGDKCKQKDQYLSLDKKYTVEILLGVSTDTGDVMGKIIDKSLSIINKIPDKHIKSILKEFVGSVTWPYPSFSSKTVDGKPLFLWSLEDRIKEIQIPERTSEIYQLQLLKNAIVELSELEQNVYDKIDSIKLDDINDSKKLGKDFRKKEVIQSWRSFFKDMRQNDVDTFRVITIETECSSGTYMRTLARKIGQKLSTPALALSITRTKIMIQ